MAFKLAIKNTDNAAFGESDDDKRHEIARILREAADKLDQGRDYAACMDFNGNKVGEWSL
jgi:hypothetical protein